VGEAIWSPLADVHRLVVAGFGRLRAASVAHRPSEDVIDVRGFSAAKGLCAIARERSRAFGPRRVSEQGSGGEAPRLIFDN
jgi:hypothetical protein